MQLAALALFWSLYGAAVIPPDSIVPENDAQAGRYYQQTADGLASWGAFEPALRNYRKALERDPKLAVARVHLARTMGQMGLVMPAIQQVQLVLKAAPQDRDASLLYGQLVLQSGRAREAELVVRPVVDRDAKDAEAHRLLGVTLLAQKELDQAASQFRLATKADPEEAESYKLLAQVQLAQEKTPEAVVTLQKYRTLRPGDLQVAMILADVLVTLGRHEEALALGLKLIAEQPDNPRLMMGIAGQLLKVQRRDEAATFFRKALALAKEPALVLEAANFLAEYSASKGRFGDAAGYLRRVITTKPELLPPRLMLVRMYSLAQNWRAAAGAARAVSALQPDNLGFRMQLFDLQLRAAQYAAAVQTAEAVVARWRDDPGIYATLAGGLVRAGQASRGIRFLETARRRFPQFRQLAYMLHDLYRQLGRSEAALKLLQAIYADDPNDPMARHGLAVEAFAKLDYERVVELLEPLARARHLLPEFYPRLAWALEKTERYGDAAVLYQMLAMGSDRPTMLLNVARQFEKMGDADAAFKVYHKILESAPEHIPTLIALGRLFGNMKQYLEASQVFEKVVVRQPDNPLAWRSLGLAYTALKQPLMAEAAYRRLAQVDPGNALAVVEVGRMQAAQHDVDQAIETWLAGLKKLPDSAALHRVLAEAYQSKDDYPEAIAHYTAAARAEPSDFTTLLAGAIANEKVGLFGEARRWYREILDDGPETTFVYRRWLESFELEGAPELGLKSGLQLMAKRPGSDLLADAVMEQATRSGQLALLGNQLAKILPARAHEPAWLDLEGRRMMASGETAKAGDWYGKLSREAPLDTTWKLRSGEVAEAKGDLRAARKQYEAASRLSPNDPAPLRDLTRAQIAEGRDDDAMLTLRRLINLAPDDPAGFERLVKLYDDQGRVEVVRAGLEELLYAPPPKGKPQYRENPAVLGAFGLACELAGQPVAAADAYRKALDLNAHQLSARMGLRRVAADQKKPSRLGPAR